MKLDLKQYVKVKDDKSAVVLKNHKGHAITIAKDAVSPKLRGEFAAMPIYMADGGSVDEIVDQPTVTDVEMPQGPNPSIDEDTIAKRDLYNRHILGNFDPGAQTPHLPGVTFGPNGEEPNNFHPEIWNKAENEFNSKVKRDEEIASSEEKANTEEILKQNEARAKAGMKPLTASSSGEASLTTSPVSTAAPVNEPTGGGAALATTPVSGQGIAQDPSQQYQQGLQQEQAAIGQTYLAQTQAAEQRAHIAAQQIANEQAMQKHFQESSAQVEGHINDTLEDIKNSHINPNHYMESMGALGKVGTAIGLILSGLGSGASGQENMAMKFLNQQIDRDIASQKENLGKKDTLLSGYYKQFGNMKDAQSMALATQQRIYAAQLEQAAAKAVNPAAQAQLLAASGKFNQQAALNSGQVSMKMTMMKGLQSGNVNPAAVIEMTAPDSDKPRLHKDLEEVQDLAQSRDNAMRAFNTVAKSSTLGDMLTSPRRAWSGAEEESLNSSLIELAKEEGKVNENVLHSIEKQYKPTFKDTAADIKMKMKALDAAFTRKMNKPSLTAYGINPQTLGVMSLKSKNKIQESGY